MTPLTREWVIKAEGDYATARRELRSKVRPNFDAVCFHAQQCAEKYLKALLQEKDLEITRSHNLVALGQAVKPFLPDVAELTHALRTLTGYAVELRYPGKFADRRAARDAVAFCSKVRGAARKALGIARARIPTARKPRPKRA